MKKGVVFLLALLFVCIGGITGCSNDETKELENMSGKKEEKTNISEPLELYQFLQESEAYPYTLNETATTFLDEHEELFPAQNVAELESYIDKSVEYKHCEIWRNLVL